MTTRKEYELEDPSTSYQLGFNPDVTKVIHIVSKMLNWAPERLLIEMINREIALIKQNILEGSLEFFEDFFDKSEIPQELKTLLEDLK